MATTASRDLTPRDLHTNGNAPAPGTGVVVFYGYLTKGAEAGSRRLSEVPRGADYIDINARDIVDRFPADGDGHPAGRVAIWVRRGTDVISCQKVKASSFDGANLRRWPRG